MKRIFFLALVFLRWRDLNSGYANAVSNDLDRTSQKSFQINCTNDVTCQDFILDSKCSENICQCPLSHPLLNMDKTKCLEPSQEFGSSCEEDLQCSTLLSSGGICQNKRCRCKNGYHYLKGLCWKSKRLNEKCVKDEQCFSAYDYRGMKCHEKKCSCLHGYYNRLGSGCRKIRAIGEKCGIDSDCVDDIKCENMKCGNLNISLRKETDSIESLTKENFENSSCSRGKFNLDGKCVLELGMKCSTDANCSHITKAKCLDNLCSCEHVTGIANENNRKCLQVARGNIPDISKSTCKESPQCMVFGENSICENKKCACKNGTYWEPGYQFCWAIKRLGETCESHLDCHPSQTQAECNEKPLIGTRVCTCKAGYYEKGNICLPMAEKVGDHCEEDKHCSFPNSACNSVNNSCVCKPNHYPQQGQCFPGVGSFCQSDIQCTSILNTHCVEINSADKRCMCTDNHTNSEDYRYCLPVRSFNEPCFDSFQCKFRLGELAECNDRKCSCHESAHYYENHCYRNRIIGESCKSKPECFLGNDTHSTICLKGYCACHYDFTYVDNKTCIKSTAAIDNIRPVFLLSTLLFVKISQLT